MPDAPAPLNSDRTGSDHPAPGSLMRADIAEQPDAWRRLLDAADQDLARARDLLHRAAPRFVLFAARGTSDHAALYGSYLAQTSLGLPAGLASPSVTTLYGAQQHLDDVLLVGVSQSGRSPDLLRTLEAARAAGALTVAVTNDPDSPLASAADVAVDLRSGPEHAVAATKTYTAELLAIALLLGSPALRSALQTLPDLAEEVLASAGAVIPSWAARYRYATRVVTAGRGFSSASAREAALKLTETAYVSAHGYSTADLLHGPMAMLDESVPLLCFASAGPDAQGIHDLVALAATRGVDVDVIGDGSVTGTDTGPSAREPLPPLLPGLVAAGFDLTATERAALRPLLEILPAQLLAAEVALDRGFDPDAPRGLSKITRTL